MQIPTLVRRFTLIFHGVILRSRNGSLAFDNDKCHVTAFRPISEAVESWSYDKYKLSPRGRRDDMPPRRRQFDSRRIYVRPRTGPQSAHLWWRAVAKLQAASVPIA